VFPLQGAGGAVEGLFERDLDVVLQVAATTRPGCPPCPTEGNIIKGGTAPTAKECFEEIGKATAAAEHLGEFFRANSTGIGALPTRPGLPPLGPVKVLCPAAGPLVLL